MAVLLTGAFLCSALATPASAGTKVIPRTILPGVTSKAPSPITPVFATITNFTSYTGPFPFVTGTFYVKTTGAYSFNLSSPGVSNGFYILKGKFSPSTGTPSTPLSNFIVFSQQLTSTTISNVNLQAGQEYSYLEIFSTAAPHTATLTINGPGEICVGAPCEADPKVTTVAAISRFLGARNNQILTNEPDAGRQVDRLVEAGGSGASTGLGETTGFAAAAPGLGLAPAQLGDGPGAAGVRAASFGVGSRPAGNAVAANTAAGPQLGVGSAPSTPGASAVDNCSSGFTAGFGGFGSAGIGAGPSGPGGSSTTRFGQFGSPALAGLGDPCWSSSGGGGAMALSGVRFSGTLKGAARLGFSTSLRDLTRAAAEADAMKAAEAGMSLSTRTGAAATARPNPFDIWIEGRYASFDDNRNHADLSGRFGALWLGADYVLSPSLLIGTMVQLDSMQQGSDSRSTDVRGTGWMAGPYATMRLSQHVFLQVRGAWGQSSNKISPLLTYSDNFDSSRWLVSSTLSGRWTKGAWSFRPSASLAYMEDASESYVSSVGVFIPSVKSTLGQAKIGPEIAYRFDLGNTVIEPRAGMQVIYNFAQDSTVEGVGPISGEVVGPAGARGRAEIGVRAITAGGLSLDLAGSYDGIGIGGYNALAGRAMVRVPLH